jgi:hypothetical protein
MVRPLGKTYMLGHFTADLKETTYMGIEGRLVAQDRCHR